jgi:hypothetical protein
VKVEGEKRGDQQSKKKKKINTHINAVPTVLNLSEEKYSGMIMISSFSLSKI